MEMQGSFSSAVVTEEAKWSSTPIKDAVTNAAAKLVII